MVDTCERPAEAKRTRGLDPRFAEYRATGERAVRNELIEEHRWLALHCARRFDHRGESFDDLVQVATIGLLKAVERFDPDYGVVFSTFAVPTVVGELRRHFRDRTWAVHVPRRAKEVYLTVTKVVDELTQTLGRSPTVPEIADRAAVEPEHVLEAIEVSGCYNGVPFTPADDDESADELVVGVDEPGFGAAEARMTVRIALDALTTQRERDIVHMRFVERLSQSQIAARIGVSQVHVSRLLRDSLDKMRRHLGGRRP